jgi:hypothetical protein
MSRPHKETKVIHRKLGKEQAWGQATIESNKIEIDERLKSYRYMLILIHEKLHLEFPEFSETRIRKHASKIARFMWKNHFRWVDLK